MINNSGFFKVLDSFRELSFILDNKGRIIFSNQAAKVSRFFERQEELFFNYFPEESKKKVSELFYTTITQRTAITEVLGIEQKENKADIKLNFTYYNIESDEIVIAKVTELGAGEPEGKKIKFTSSRLDLNELLKDPIQIKIFEQLKSDFPFTLISKNNFKKEINKLDDLFWIKDPQRKYVVVNNSFAHFLGLPANQVEGRYEYEFLPPYLSDFSKSMGNYVRNTSNVIIQEGFPFLYTPEDKNLRIIEIPICDLDNEVLALVGISQNIQKEQNENEFFGKNLVKNLEVPVLVIDVNNKLIFVNSSFKEKLPLTKYDTNGKIIFNAYSELSFELNKFLYSEELAESVKKINIPTNNFSNTFFDFQFRKIYNEGTELKGLMITIIEDDDDILNKIFKASRGKMYEVIIQNSPEPMFVYDIENLRFLEVNRAALNLYGYTKDEFMQMDLTDLYAPEDIQTLLNTSESEMGEMKFTGPWRQKKKDGSIVFVEISKSNFQFREKNAHFNIIRDITENIKIQKEVQLYKASYDNSNDLLFTVDSDGFVVSANKVSLDILGYTYVELDCRPFITLVSDDNRSLILNNIFNTEISSTIKLSASLKKKNGELIAMTILATPIFDLAKQIVAYSLIASPEILTTQLKSSEAADAAVSKKVVQEKGIDIEFLSNVFHEILTPMNVILGFVQEIVENIEKPTLEQKESMEIIEQNREVLLQTMNSLLEYSHLEQNKIEFITKKFLFTDVVESLQKRTQKIAKTRNIEFSYGKISSSLNIETDVQKLETFLVMFITIAMHITREKKIFLSAYQYNDEHFIVSVKDSRKSVSPYLAENLKNILTGVSYKKDFGVSRLTLKLSNKLREMLSGEFKYIERNNEILEAGFVFPMVVVTPGKLEIKEAEIIAPEEVEETPAHETVEEFEVAEEIITTKFEPHLKTTNEFEREAAVKEELVEVETPSKKNLPEEKIEVKPEIIQEVKPKEKFDLTNVHCLYVEDQVDSQILFKVQLKEAKKIDFAVSFEAALPLLQQFKYDFIVLDINLQGEYNGLDALRIIRKLPGYETSKIIAVTAYVLPGDKDKFIAAGFNDFISKPILREKLIDSLNKIMNT